MQIFQIIRWKNLVMIAFMQVLVKYFLLPLFRFPDSLSVLHFIFIVLASVFIAAGGYVINDIYDLEADRINKPSKVWIPIFLDLKKAKTLYLVFSLLGFLLGVLVSIFANCQMGFLLFLMPIGLLYIYAIWAKKVLIFGNLLVSLLVSYSLVLIAVFEKIPFRTAVFESLTIQTVVWMLVFFAFIMNLVREIVKDVEDVEGDISNGVVSIPIRLGIKKTKQIISVLLSFVFMSIAIISVLLYKQQPLLIAYLVFVVLLSFLFFTRQLHKAKTNTDFGKLSSYLKIIMILGMLAVFVIKPI